MPWKSSKKPRKQRSYRIRAPLHIKQKFMHSHLSNELRKKNGMRSIGLRKGDRVKVARGVFRNHVGKVERIDLKKARVFISGIELNKKDGAKKTAFVDPSNIIITELYLDDKLRQRRVKAK